MDHQGTTLLLDECANWLMINRIGYRIRQFRQSFKPALSQNDLDRLRLYLSPVEIVLFTKMPAPDQIHSISVLNSVMVTGEKDEDLIKAALLHDIGKGLHRLRRWERVFAVVIGGLFPKLDRAWGIGEPEGFRRPLVIIHQHPDWGAELAAGAGCREELVWLIQNHENYQLPESTAPRKLELLKILQSADNQN